MNRSLQTEHNFNLKYLVCNWPHLEILEKKELLGLLPVPPTGNQSEPGHAGHPLSHFILSENAAISAIQCASENRYALVQRLQCFFFLTYRLKLRAFLKATPFTLTLNTSIKKTFQRSSCLTKTHCDWFGFTSIYEP